MQHYCIKSSGEVIGTHKAWLALRDNDPARYDALRNSRDIELVRIGYHMRDSLDTITRYGLLNEHKRLCVEYMQKEIATVQADIATLESDLSMVLLSPLARDLLDNELRALIERRDTWAGDLMRGALRLSSAD